MSDNNVKTTQAEHAHTSRIMKITAPENDEHIQTITAQQIEEMTYTDFVGFINQWNVLPGAYTTLSEWKVYSTLTEQSTLLEIACTTGFTSRELAVLSGCKARGFDISKRSVEAAAHNAKKYAPHADLHYECANGYTFEPKQQFTHVAIGAALKFFPDPERMLERCISWLQDSGYILASPFYIRTPIPEQLIEEFKTVFGITPTTEPYKEIMKAYKGLEIIYENRKTIEQETDEELEHYCTSTIQRVAQEKSITKKEIIGAMYNRLLQIKIMSNKLRPYQGYSVLVLRYEKNVYPNRFVELF